jgi:hypothetical protein
MALLPEEQRVLIGLVCIDRYSYKDGRHDRHAHRHDHEPTGQGAARIACAPRRERA